MLNGSLHPDYMLLLTLFGIACGVALVALGALLDRWHTPGEPLWLARIVLRAPGVASRFVESATGRIAQAASALAERLHLPRT